MKHKTKILLCTLVALLLLGSGYVMLTAPYRTLQNNGREVQCLFRAEDKEFLSLRDGEWEKFKISGVNLGGGYPGLFPKESELGEEIYLDWLQNIGRMNANTVRVYQLQPPAFYKALAEYNESAESPIYLIQGINLSDDMMYSEKNILDRENTRELFSFSRSTVDALHGDCLLLQKEMSELRIYTEDVSRYVLGYILGVEWDELFVEYNCLINEGTEPFSGKYFSCSPDASPFESFLASWAEEVLSYETERYALQPMISFANWAETDPLINEVQIISTARNTPEKNRESTVDTEHVLPTELNKSGIFASYNVYPYYPMFLQYGPYTVLKDEMGRNNPYQGYLHELAEYHSCPVLVSEFGVPACRSTAYRDIWRSYSHGGLNEKQQAQAVVTLYRDIMDAGCAGALVFTWQDEWFKRAWNEMELSDPDGRVFWSNAQCAEQSFGIMAFEPGSPGSIVYPDGELDEWSEKDLIRKKGRTKLYMRSDERYLYFMARGLDTRKGNAVLNIALDVSPKSGAITQAEHSFDRPVDFIIRLGSDMGRLYVHGPYDVMVYSMGDKLHPELNRFSIEKLWEEYLPENTGEFRPVLRARGSIHSQMRHFYEMEPAGELKPGNANPRSSRYDSNADYYIKDDSLELRIPWQLLNFRDPSRCLIVDDLEENNLRIGNLEIDAVYAAGFFDGEKKVQDFGTYRLKGWKNPTFHQRLKPAYYALQREFEENAG